MMTMTMRKTLPLGPSESAPGRRATLHPSPPKPTGRECAVTYGLQHKEMWNAKTQKTKGRWRST